ncbi:MAG: hypothetical protein R6W92_06820 [Desulfocurvibacter africanus]
MDQRTTESVRAKHEFTEDEMKKLAETMSAQHLLAGQLEDEKKSVQQSYKLKIDSAMASAMDAAGKYRDGYEMRDHECERVYDYESDPPMVRFVEVDTGKEIVSRRMTHEELHRPLPGFEQRQQARQ